MTRIILHSLIAALLAWFGSKYALSLPNPIYQQAMSDMFMVAITLLGFLLTLIAIMTTMSERRLIKNIAKTGHLKNMYNRFFLAIAGFFVCVLLSLFYKIGLIP